MGNCLTGSLIRGNCGLNRNLRLLGHIRKRLLFLRTRAVKSRIKCIEVFGIQFILGDAKRFTESLEMDDFPYTEIADGVTDIRVFYHTKDIVVGGAGFLFCCNCERTTYHVKQIGQAAFIHAKTEY